MIVGFIWSLISQRKLDVCIQYIGYMYKTQCKGMYMASHSKATHPNQCGWILHVKLYMLKAHKGHHCPFLPLPLFQYPSFLPFTILSLSSSLFHPSTSSPSPSPDAHPFLVNAAEWRRFPSPPPLLFSCHLSLCCAAASWSRGPSVLH